MKQIVCIAVVNGKEPAACNLRAYMQKIHPPILRSLGFKHFITPLKPPLMTPCLDRGVYRVIGIFISLCTYALC